MILHLSLLLLFMDFLIFHLSPPIAHKLLKGGGTATLFIVLSSAPSTALTHDAAATARSLQSCPTLCDPIMIVAR